MKNRRNSKKIRGLKLHTTTLYERVRDMVDRQYSYIDEAGRKRMTKQFFAKKLVGGRTIGRDANGKLQIH